MELGYDDTVIESVTYENDQLIIKGANFNINSTVYFGKTKKKTVYVDENTLIVELENLDKDLQIVVKQVSNQNEVYTSSNVFTFEK